MNQIHNPWRVLVICTLLALATLAVFWPVLQNDFINYDDPDYVTANEVVKKGFTWEGVKWAFTTSQASNWHPITWLSHMLDVSWVGLRPMGHHATSLMFHMANALLLFLLFRQLTGAVWRSALVAALFALHPLHVESVAWVAERKDVLSAFFGLLSLVAYTHFAQCKMQDAKYRTAWYGASLAFFALGLMSKPMLVTWPFVMLLLDFWPLNRIDPNAIGWSAAFRKAGKALVLEKLPFFALAALSSGVTVVVQHGAMAQTELLPIGDRAANATLAVTRYLEQTVWPTKLAVFYPFPTNFPLAELAVASGIFIAVLTYCLRQARTQPWVIVGWLWFLGTLVPVFGLVQVGAQARADRYTYLPLIGIFFALSWSLLHVRLQGHRIKWIVSAAAFSVLIAFGIASRAQLRHWRDDRSLWNHAAGVTTENYMAWGGLGIADVKAANWPSALTNLTRAYEYAKPHHTERSMSYYLGVALQMQGQPLEALPHLERCLVSAEMQPERDHRLGLSLMEAGRLAEAELSLKSALAAKPQNLNYQLGWAAFQYANGQPAGAEATHREAIASHPQAPLAIKAYADFLMSVNRVGEAVTHYEAAVKLAPTETAYRKAYANALRRAGAFKVAAAQYEEIFKTNPAKTQELLDLAELYSQSGQTWSVLDCYNRALNLEPESVPTLNNLAWFLATCEEASIRDGPRAVALAEKACTLTEWKAAVLMGTLAAAYAEAGRFPDAVAMAKKAIFKAHDDQQNEVANRNVELLEFYRQGKTVPGDQPKGR